jgi:hypothetical protein
MPSYSSRRATFDTSCVLERHRVLHVQRTDNGFGRSHSGKASSFRVFSE